MTHYIIQVIVFQLLFLAVYLLALKNETFFTYNRMYLIGVTMVSFVLPFLKFDIINEQIPTLFRTQLPTVFLGNTGEEINGASFLLDPVFITASSISVSTILFIIYGLGVAIAAALFILKLRKLAGLRKIGNHSSYDGYRVCVLPQSNQAFTFLRTMYLGDLISEAEKTHIIAHEKIHIDQRHALDLLLFEVLKIVFWFNPMVYVFQKQLQTLHEYAADYAVAKDDKNEYYQKLLSRVFGTTSISFINTFFNHSLIKKRITMLQKSKSNRISIVKYLLIIPFIAGMLTYTSCANESTEDATIAEGDTEVMQKINELAEAIMKVGNISDEEIKALEFLAAEAKPGDKIYTSVQEYLDDPDAKRYKIIERNDWVNQSDVPFAVIDQVPVFPGCENQKNNATSKSCFSEAIQKHVGENFNTKLANDTNLSGKQRISVQFKITKNGMISDVKARAPHPLLEAEAIRVVNLLPKVTPGMHEDKAVGVLYSLPILFNIEE